MADIRVIAEHITSTLELNGYNRADGAPILLWMIGALIRQVEVGRGYPVSKEYIQLLLANAIAEDQERKAKNG